MLETKDKMIDYLQEVLSNKSFSKNNKEKIKELLLDILDFDIEDKEKHIQSLIDGLKKIDTLQFDTREKLLEVEGIKEKLPSSTVGFVYLPEKILVVVKHEQDQATLYHELVHTTQNEYSYYVNEKYAFSEIIELAMKEGEALNKETILAKKKFPNTIRQPGVSRIVFSPYSKLYEIYLEFYQDMANILGKDLIEEWKQLKDSTVDLIPKFNSHIKKQYGDEFDISKIFNLWSSILYNITMKFSGRGIEKGRIKYALLEREYLYSNNKVLYDQILLENYELNNSVKKIIEEVSNINSILNDDEKLNSNFLEIKKRQREELREYILEYGNDDISTNWQEEINSVKLDDYKESLINDRLSLYNKYKDSFDKLNKITLEKHNLEWLNNFYTPSETIDLTNLVTLKEKEISKMLYKDEGVTMKNDIPSSFFLSFEKTKEDNFIKKSK